MATETYTELTPEKCKEMLLNVLELDPEASDEEITAAYEHEMGEDAPAEAAEATTGEDEGGEGGAMPGEEMMAKRAPAKFKGSAMKIIVKAGR